MCLNAHCHVNSCVLTCSDHRELRNSQAKLGWWVDGGCRGQRPQQLLLLLIRLEQSRACQYGDGMDHCGERVEKVKGFI